MRGGIAAGSLNRVQAGDFRRNGFMDGRYDRFSGITPLKRAWSPRSRLMARQRSTENRKWVRPWRDSVMQFHFST